MTTPKDDGGPAFPFATIDGHLCLGMTLRDYFAAKAAVGIMGMIAAGKHDLHFDKKAEDSIAIDAYRLADAMLKARQS